MRELFLKGKLSIFDPFYSKNKDDQRYRLSDGLMALFGISFGALKGRSSPEQQYWLDYLKSQMEMMK